MSNCVMATGKNNCQSGTDFAKGTDVAASTVANRPARGTHKTALRSPSRSISQRGQGGRLQRPAMKKTPTTLPASPATTTQTRELPADPGNQHSPMAPSPLPSEILLKLGAIVASLQIAAAFGDQAEHQNSPAVIAGIVVALSEIIPPRQFRQVMVQWEMDEIKLAEIFSMAGLDPADPDIQKIIEL